MMTFRAILLAVTGLATVFFDVAYQSYVPLLVHDDDIGRANSRLETTKQLAITGGPALFSGTGSSTQTGWTVGTGVEWAFWKGPTDCTGPVGNLGSAGNLLERLDTVKVVRCDEVQWRFLGLSLAGYNVLISLLMALIAVWGIGRTAKRS